MNFASENHEKIIGFYSKSDGNHNIVKVSRSFAISIGFYEDLRVWEASGTAPGGSPGTFSERFGGFEKVLRGFWRF